MTDVVDFRMHENSDFTLPIICIKIPKVCCGIVTEVTYSLLPNQQDHFANCCATHMSLYEDVWKNFVVDKIHFIQKQLIVPLKCVRCNNINEYATKEHCQKNGTYICRSCISYTYWDCKIPEEPLPDVNIPILKYLFLRQSNDAI